MNNPQPPASRSAGNCRPWTLIAVVLGILLLLGYGVTSIMNMASRKTGELLMEKMIERSTGGKANVDLDADGGMKIKTDQGSFATGQTVPADWPTDVPVYPGATVQYSASVNPADGKQGKALILMTQDAADTVAAYYKSEFAKQGWTMSGDAQAGDSMMMAAKKDDRSVSVMLGKSEDRTMITLGVGQAQ